jgi:hypothetical protein
VTIKKVRCDVRRSSKGQKRYLGFFETGVYARFEVPKVGEHAFFKLFKHGCLDRSPERFEPAKKKKGDVRFQRRRKWVMNEPKDEGTNDIGAGDVVETVPQDARDVFVAR